MRNRSLILIGAILIYYTLVDFIITDLMLYLSGGLIGGSITVVFNLFGVSPSIHVIWIVWFIFLMIWIWIFYNTRNIYFRYVLIVIITHFLYLIDIVLIGTILPDNTVTSITNMNIAIRVICKSIILILVILRHADSYESSATYRPDSQ
jgi:hypothetical protein